MWWARDERGPEAAHSDFHDLLFLFLDDVVDLLPELIRELLGFLFGFPQLVLGQLRIFLKFLQLFVGIAPESANLHFRVLAVFFADFRQFLSPFFGKRWQRDSDEFSVIRRCDPEA